MRWQFVDSLCTGRMRAAGDGGRLMMGWLALIWGTCAALTIGGIMFQQRRASCADGIRGRDNQVMTVIGVYIVLFVVVVYAVNL